MQTYIHSADKRGYEFLLTENQFKEITQKNCYYCGIKPLNKMKTSNDEYVYNGVDRVNNTKGYILDNVVSCCETCNKAKRVMSDKEFKQWIIRIYNYWANK
jgi:5-methylcytosine-specific restriction endonuclease McrA